MTQKLIIAPIPSCPLCSSAAFPQNPPSAAPWHMKWASQAVPNAGHKEQKQAPSCRAFTLLILLTSPLTNWMLQYPFLCDNWLDTCFDRWINYPTVLFPVGWLKFCLCYCYRQLVTLLCSQLKQNSRFFQFCFFLKFHHNQFISLEKLIGRVKSSEKKT